MLVFVCFDRCLKCPDFQTLKGKARNWLQKRDLTFANSFKSIKQKGQKEKAIVTFPPKKY